MDEDIDVIAENAVSAIKHAELYAHPDAFMNGFYQQVNQVTGF